MDRKIGSGFMFGYNTNKSQYHDSCIPAEKKQLQQDTGGKQFREAEYSNCDHVSQDTIWKQAVGTEKRCLKNWEQNWGFLSDFDAHGKPKEREELPESAHVFSDNVPNTNSGNYGNRVTTDLGQTMQEMEFAFYSGGRRKKLGNDMICY